MLFMLSAYVADAIGLHAVFGGFLLGTVMPRGTLADNLRKLLEPFTVVLLLPMFFTYSGLNTQLSMVNNVELLLIALVHPGRVHPGEVRRLLGGGSAERSGQQHGTRALAR